LANDVETALALFSHDAFDPRLRTHKLSGPLEDRWACSVTYEFRIVFRFVSFQAQEAILLLSIGTQDDVY
jgi:mRNA interferase YafQ